MKYSLSILLGFLFIGMVSAQVENPVKWDSKVLKNEDGTYSLHVTANIDNGWVLYSQHTDPSGPIPTEFVIDSKDVELIGDFEEKSKAKKGMSEMFGVEVIKFSKSALFTQKFDAKDAKAIKGNVTFMTCDNQRCLPPTTVEFSAEL